MIYKFLIDTDILIDHLRGDEVATDLIQDVYTGRVKAFILVITECEILSSDKISASEKRQIRQLLNTITKLSITSKIAQKAGDFRSAYPKLEIGDALIAANCFYAKTILLTRNLKHFEQIKEIKVDTI